MARTKTLTQLLTAVRTRGDWENSADITDAILTEFLNEGIAELWDILVGKWADYYATAAAVATSVIVAPYSDTIALPTTFYKLRKLELLTSGTADTVNAVYTRLRPHDLESSHQFAGGDTRHYRYRIQGSAIRLVPWPTRLEAFRLTFVPYATELVSGADTFDGINGYEAFAVQLALRRALARQDLPTDQVDAEIARLTLRVRTAADSRDAAEPFYLNPRGPSDNDDDDGELWP
jgi:hypothetical protein